MQCRNQDLAKLHSNKYFVEQFNVTNLTKIITTQTDRKKPRIPLCSDRQKETKDTAMPSFQTDRKKPRIPLCLRFRQTERNQGYRYAFVSDRQKETKDTAMPSFQTDRQEEINGSLITSSTRTRIIKRAIIYFI